MAPRDVFKTETPDLFAGQATNVSPIRRIHSIGEGNAAENWSQSGHFCANRGPGSRFTSRAPLSAAEAAAEFLQSLKIPQGPTAGEPLRLAGFQRDFVNGALAEGVNAAVLSIGRGNAKTALAAGLALGALLGVWDDQPRREILIAARTREQGAIAWNFAAGFAESLPVEIRARLLFRRAPRLEIEFEGHGGPHILKVLAADGKTALGGSPTLALMDERGHWPQGKGDELEAALLSGLGKRGGRALIISTSAPNDAHPFSRWLDDAPPGTYTQEHRPPPGLPADDLDSLLIANPGAAEGIGATPAWLQAEARRAIARGGSPLSMFRLYNRNERVSDESRSVLLTPDQWRACEVAELPPRAGGVVVGIDLGASASMSAAAFYWPETGRLEAFGTFPTSPALLDRGQTDSVGDRYVQMHDRGELTVLGDRVVPPAAWLLTVTQRALGEQILCIVADRYKGSEVGQALNAAGIRAPVIWRGMGSRDGGEDVTRFQRAALDDKVWALPSLLLRSAFADAVIVHDDAGNPKLAKGRSMGRIDAAAAAVLAVAQGSRIADTPQKKVRISWA